MRIRRRGWIRRRESSCFRNGKSAESSIKSTQSVLAAVENAPDQDRGSSFAGMSSTFEQFVISGVMSILVLLFGSIYARERNRKYGLWMLGWMAILVHFSVPLITHWYPVSVPLLKWASLTTALMAGSCFLLSVSDVYRGRRRFIFVGSISCSALLYL